ncbi:hypothetical protein NMG60_11000728 [Bertholletia excelsa]
MDPVALVLELMATITMLVIKPFCLIKLFCIFCLRSFCIVIFTWVELLRTAVNVHVDIIWRIINLIISLVCLPVRVLTALQRERLLQMHLHELQIELENLLWSRKEVEQHLHVAIKECRMMESMLEELEDEHDQAIVKIELLESKLQDIKQENLHLKELQGKQFWSYQSQDDKDKGNGHHQDVADKCSIPYGIQPGESHYNRSNIVVQDLIHKDAWESKIKMESHELFRTGLKASELIHAVSPRTISRNIDENEILGQQRNVAFSQTLFSAVLSLLVAVVIWQAKDPCMPLVVALFTVVGMSLKSVVQFFSTIKNKPASDAVALLSFNWFMLGTLTYPTLPRVARMLTPMALSLLGRTLSWLGFTL